MFFNNKAQAVIAFFSLAFASHFVYKHFRKKYKKAAINEVIMFSYGTTGVKRSKLSRCLISPSMERLLYYLSSPRRSIDICMYVMTNVELTNEILKLAIRGVRIRVIIDADMAFSNGSSLKRLEKQGIPVRWMKSTNLMHHKFCLIDTEFDDIRCTPLVIIGSLNWTTQALNGNWENVAVTSQETLVEQYKNEFDRLWLEFKPIVDIA
ncbi:uncharacterized protein LOC112057035 [Bicyclus anynana]|uniref:Mitochondrial cardiolipin hydrolase n=1 Tax=Bicyclus anynana TaxID=110368 RepID=A0A6J1P673_BICAN|nr:uncharacterized protein LOC112057035 [Bicyclus anynana]